MLPEQDALIGQRECATQLQHAPRPSTHSGFNQPLISSGCPARRYTVRDLLTLFPFCSRAYHAGFTGYNHGDAAGL